MKNVLLSFIGDRLLGSRYQNRDDHYHKIRARKQTADIGEYSFVNRKIKLWEQLPAGTVAPFRCKSRVFRKRVRKINVSK
jgi:hypothetical protein